jgi:DNA-binding response OmpR family regulator
MYARLIAQDADEVAIFSLILQRAGLAVTTTKDLEATMRSWSERPADILLLALPAPSPQDQVRRVRAETQVPLLLAIASDEANLQVELLKLGADLVITPAFDPKLLIAQIGALLRRASNIPTFSLPTLSAAGLTLDPTTRTVEISGKPTQRLTHLEFRLLYTLIINRDQVLPTETLVERVWGYTGQGDRELVRGLISRLRNKVELDPHNPRYILTMPGIGYVFKEQTSKILDT